MELKYIVAADTANQSREGKMNIAGEFNTFRSTAVPFSWPTFTIVARLEVHLSEGPKHAAQIKIMDPDGVLILDSPPIPVDFADQGKGVPLRADLMAQVVGATFPVFGDYGVHVFVDGVHRGDLTLYVRQNSPEPKPGPS